MIRQTGILRKKVFEAVFALGIKRVIVQAIFTISNIFLARLLFPSDFGMFAIVTFVGSIFLVFADIGLGAALIQKKDKITTDEMQTVFTFQFFLSFLIFLFINLIASFASGYYGFGDRGTLLFHIFSFYFLFGPFKTTAGAILERNLEYRKLVIVEFVEIFCASASTVVLAILGYGVFSFVVGGICGHIVGAAFYFIFSPWPIRFRFSAKILSRLARFGLPLQVNGILSLFLGPFVLLYLGKSVGTENLGFFQFAASLSVLPLAVSEIVNRVIFPLGARLQQDKVLFKKIIEKSMVVVSLSTLPILTIGIASASEIVHLVYTDKWLPSLPALYLGLVQTSTIAYTGIFSQLLLSRGKAKYLRNMALVWAVLTWLLAPLLIRAFNFVGMSMTGLLVSVSGLWLCFKLNQEVDFSIVKNIFPYFFSAIIAGFSTFLVLWLMPTSFVVLFFAALLGFFVYISCLFLLIREIFLENLRIILNLNWRGK